MLSMASCRDSGSGHPSRSLAPHWQVRLIITAPRTISHHGHHPSEEPNSSNNTCGSDSDSRTTTTTTMKGDRDRERFKLSPYPPTPADDSRGKRRTTRRRQARVGNLIVTVAVGPTALTHTTAPTPAPAASVNTIDGGSHLINASRLAPHAHARVRHVWHAGRPGPWN